jgi:hypothetical protein
MVHFNPLLTTEYILGRAKIKAGLTNTSEYLVNPRHAGWGLTVLLRVVAFRVGIKFITLGVED